MYKHAMAKRYIAIVIDHKCNQNSDKWLRNTWFGYGSTGGDIRSYVYHSQHMCMRVKLNFTCKEVAKTRVAMYMKVIDVVCHCVLMTKTCMCNLHGLYVSHVCHV